MKSSEKRVTFFILTCVTIIFIILSSSATKADSESNMKVIYLSKAGKGNSTIFNGDELLSPGDKITKTFSINNNNGFTASINNIKLEGALFDSDGKTIDKDSAGYRDFLNNSSIVFYCEGNELFKGTLSEYINLDLPKDKAILIAKEGLKNCTMEYKMAESAGNSIMGINYKFDIVFTYSEVPPIVKTGEAIDFKALMLIGTFLSSIGLFIIFNRIMINKKSA